MIRPTGAGAHLERQRLEGALLLLHPITQPCTQTYNRVFNYGKMGTRSFMYAQLECNSNEDGIVHVAMHKIGTPQGQAS